MSTPLCCSNLRSPTHKCALDLKLKSSVGLRSSRTDEFLVRRRDLNVGNKLEWSFVGGTAIVIRHHNACESGRRRKEFTTTSASWLTATQIATNSFTLGTAAVLPFYTLMVFAPNADITKKTMESGIPYITLGLLYSYLLYLSWSPETLRYMFATKYWLPELAGMVKMFGNEMTVASAWIHLLAVDLFAARQVYRDGLKNKVETRHSVSLCLLFCPIGVLTHFATKLLSKTTN